MPAEIRAFRCLSDNIGALVHDPATGACAAVDAPEEAPIVAALEEAGWTLSEIIVTHRHADHVQGIEALKRRYGCRVVAPEKARGEVPAVDAYVAEGDTVRVGELSAHVWETPGHCRDHIAYWFAADRALFAGDTLFTLGCGRVMESTFAEMWSSLSRLAALPGEAQVYSGHDYVLAERQVRARGRARQCGAQGPHGRSREGEDGGTLPHPLDDRRGEGDEPLPARRRAVGRPRRQDGGRRSRQGVPGAARMEEPVLTAMGPDALSAAEVVRLLDLRPHPEGGHFRETFRDARGESGRAASTAIYYLLGAGETSRWHRVDAAEIWHFYAGAPLVITISPDGHDAAAHRLGPDLAGGERPQVAVPADAWQTAASLGAWSLVGCTVAPGFAFAGFEMAPPGWQPTARRAGSPS